MKDGGLFKMTEDLTRSEGMSQGWEEEKREKQSKRGTTNEKEVRVILGLRLGREKREERNLQLVPRTF